MSTFTVEKPLISQAQESALPALQNGDQLHSREFLRRFEQMPDVKKAELVQSIVYMGSPVSYQYHSEPDSIVQLWLGTYAAFHPEVNTGPNATVVLDVETTVQPDAIMFYRGTAERECSVRPYGKYLQGAPELVVEIAASSVSLDANRKKDAYERAGVREYIVWRVLDEAIDFWMYDDESQTFRLTLPDASGKWHSVTFPGLVLDVAAALKFDRAGIISAISAKPQ